MQSALKCRYTMLVSVPLLVEYEAVMTRPEHLAKSRLNRNEVNRLIDALAEIAESVRVAYSWRPMSGDPNDDMIVELAMNGRATAIVTFNERHFKHASERFGL